MQESVACAKNLKYSGFRSFAASPAQQEQEGATAGEVLCLASRMVAARCLDLMEYQSYPEAFARLLTTEGEELAGVLREMQYSWNLLLWAERLAVDDAAVADLLKAIPWARNPAVRLVFMLLDNAVDGDGRFVPNADAMDYATAPFRSHGDNGVRGYEQDSQAYEHAGPDAQEVFETAPLLHMHNWF